MVVWCGQLVVRGMAGAAAAGGSDPYKVLGVPPETESDRIMFAYNKLVRTFPAPSLNPARMPGSHPIPRPTEPCPG
jgi:hypothetical protein